MILNIQGELTQFILFNKFNDNIFNIKNNILYNYNSFCPKILMETSYNMKHFEKS